MKIEKLLKEARAEAATPAPNADTVRLDWLESQKSRYKWQVTLAHNCVFATRNATDGHATLRAAIDAAIKGTS